MKKKLYVKTYGCQMNVYDSVKMQDVLANIGYSISNDMPDSDMVLLNTCHIREKAAEKVYSELGRIRDLKEARKADGKEMMIVVAGCVSQAEGDEIFRRAPYVDIVVGPQSYHNLPKLVAQIEHKAKHAIDLDFVDEEKFDLLPEESKSQGVSAFVSIQEGCDKFCAFCVVPYTRGSEFSRPLERVYRETISHVANGAREVTLLGQNVNAYHGAGPNGEQYDLAALIRKVAEIKGVERIRYTTSHPRDVNEDLIRIHAEEPKLMPFLHLPVQSGSNNILKAMNRKHTREEYFDIIQRFRDANPDMVFSSDFIIGFPGETDADFDDTMDLVKRVKYGQCYSFKYSPRPGTPAAVKEQVPEDVKTKRLTALQHELRSQQEEFNKSCEGKILPVLFDRTGKFEKQLLGKSQYMQSVHIDNASEELYGQILNVKVTEANASGLKGEVVKE